MDIQQNNVAVLHFNLVNQDGSTIFIRKTKLATFNLINPSAVSVPITDIGFDATLNQCWIRIPKASNAATGQYYGVLNIVDDDWGTYTTSKIKVYSVVSDADDDTKSVVFTATCLATQITNPSGGNSPYYNATTGTWWQYSDTLKAFEDTGVGNLIKYITKNVQHLKDGTGNGSIVTCLDDEISANNTATGLCSTDLGKNNNNRGESCVALGENNYIAEGVSNATAIAGAQPSAVDVFAVGDKTAGHKNVFEINKFGDIYFRPDSSQERTTILQDILDSVIKNVVYDSSKYSLTVTFYSASENNNKIKTYDLSGLKAVLKDDAVKEISVNQSTAVMTVNTINGSSQQIQLPTVQSDWSTTDTSADSYILNKPTALSSFTNDSGYDTVASVNSKLGNYLPLAGGTLTGDLLFSNSGTTTRQIRGVVGDSDIWRISGGATASDGGWMEIATADDGTEPIYVRQYRDGVCNSMAHSATLLDANGNTSFPGTLTITTLTVNGRGSFTNPISSTYSSPNFIGVVSNAAVNCKGGSGYVGWINGPTKGGRASISTYPNQDNVMYFNYGTSAAIAANTNVVTGIKFDLEASSILASRATFNSSTDVTLSSFGSEPLSIGSDANNLGIDGNEIQARANGAASDLFINRRGGQVHFGTNQYYITSDGSNYTGNAATSYSSNYIKSNSWNWSGVGPQGTGSTVRKIASITGMSYLEIEGVNSVGTAGDKGIVKINIAYINGIIISNNSTVSTNFGYVITSETSGNNGKVNIDLYLEEIEGENYYNILVSKLIGSAISFESPSAEAITIPSGYVAISKF